MSASTIRPLIGIPSASHDPSHSPGSPAYCYNRSYPAVLAAAGGAPVALPLDLPEDALRAIFDRLDGLCLVGGDDVDPAYYGEARHPALGNVDAARDADELLLAGWALAADLPLFAICRGIQVLNVAQGGSLYQDLSAQLPGSARHAFTSAESPVDRPVHRLRVAEGSRLGQILDAREVWSNSFHHQAVKAPGDGLRPVAWSDDGVIEAVEAPERRFALGVQWHPEGMYATDYAAGRLFAAFIEDFQDVGVKDHILVAGHHLAFEGDLLLGMIRLQLGRGDIDGGFLLRWRCRRRGCRGSPHQGQQEAQQPGQRRGPYAL